MGKIGAGDSVSRGGGAIPLYFLTPRTFLSRVDGALVFLDLPADEYVCLEPDQSEAVGRLLGLTPPPGRDGDEPGPAPAPEIALLIEEMEEAGLITPDPGSGKPADAIAHPAGLREMERFDIGAEPRVRARHVAAFLKAALVAEASLRFAPLERIVRRVARRRAGAGARADPERARELTEVFRRLRPLLMSRKDRCLLNALLMLEFLAAFGVYPAWRFGVRLQPFAAHCWVQQDELLYDEDVETVAKYSPIMTV